MGWKTKEERNNYSRQWYQQNKEKIAQYGKEWRKTATVTEEQKLNRNRLSRESYHRNKEARKITQKIWAQNNKEKTKIQTRKWYEKNKDRVNKYRQNRRKIVMDWFRTYKGTLKCLFCGYCKNINALDFHHRDSSKKKKAVASYVKECVSLKTLKEEIAKCDVLCSNCHREKHSEERLLNGTP